MLEIGQEWLLYVTPFRMKETTAPSGGEILPNAVSLYCKDRSGTSGLYWMNDAGTEFDLSATILSGSGTANRLAYWTSATALAANAALTVNRILFADSNGLPTDSATLIRDATSGFVTVKNIASGASIKLDSSNAAHNSGVYFAVNAAALYRIQIEASTSKLQIFGEGAAASALQFDTSRNTLVGTGAVATNATAPFLQLNSCAGTPTGAPSPQAGQIPLVFDSTNNKLYAFSTTWRDLTGGSGSGAISGSGTAGYVTFWTGTNALSADIKFQWDNTNKFLGLGGAPGFQFHGVAPDANSFNFTLDTYGTGAVGNYRARAARGTAGSPTALSADDLILALSGLPYGSAFASGARAQITFAAGEAISGTNQGTYITFKTTPTGGSTTIAERFRVGPAGQWGIGGATFGTAGQFFRSGGSAAAPTYAAPDHGSEVGGLADDDHTQYALLAGRSGGQTLVGGTAAADDLILKATSGNGVGSESIQFLVGNNGATEAMVISKTATELIRIGPSQSTIANLGIGKSITTSSSFARSFYVYSTFDGAGDEPAGADIFPTFTPSSNITNAHGIVTAAVANPASGVTISQLRGGYWSCWYRGDDGAVTTGIAGFFAGPDIGGALKPTGQYGVHIANQGASGITTSVGLQIVKPTGSTNNYYMSLDTADATDPTGGGGAATGRIPIVVAGVLRYLAYY